MNDKHEKRGLGFVPTRCFPGGVSVAGSLLTDRRSMPNRKVPGLFFVGGQIQVCQLNHDELSTRKNSHPACPLSRRIGSAESSSAGLPEMVNSCPPT